MKSPFAMEPEAGSKITLQLSSRAWSVLDNDCICFSNTEKTLSMSAMIAQILTNFAPDAESSVQCRCNRLDKKKQPDQWKRLHQELCGKAQARLAQKTRSRSYSRNKRMCNFSAGTEAAFESCVTLPGSREKLYPVFSAYVCALLEEYAEKPYSEREQIYFKENCGKIRAAAQSGSSLYLTHRDGSIHRFWPRPAGPLLTDALLPYTYVVGYHTRMRADGDISGGRKPEYASFRLSEIHTVEYASPDALSPEETKKLEKALEERGVPYLSGGETAWVLVRFTKDGADDFRKRLVNRPTGQRQEALEKQFPVWPQGAELWMLEGPRWKLKAYLRTFEGVSIFAKQELTPEMLDVLAARNISARKGTEAYRKELQEEEKRLKHRYMKELKKEVTEWHKRALQALQG